jgi:glycosyltransferase involved in cell wall biosynthesis
MKLSIVIPVYNEERTFLELLRWVREEPHEKEIVIVDDCSTDGTRDLLKSLEGEKDIKVFYHEKNRGKGAAIREGFKHVTGDIVIIQDADLEYYPDEYAQLIKPIVDGKADVVFGSRFLGAHRAHMFWHMVGNRVINTIANLILNTTLTDMMTCYKAFTLHTLKSLELYADRFGIEPEITAEVFRRGYKVYEVPISYNARDYEEGKKIKWTDFFVCTWWLLRAASRADDAGRDMHLRMRVMKKTNAWTLKNVKQHLGGRVLELGAGMGVHSLRLVKECAHLTVSDVDSQFLKVLNERFVSSRKADVKKVDAAQVAEALPPSSYDTVVALNMMEHVLNDESMLKGSHQVLKDGGKLLLQVPAHQWLYSGMDETLQHFRRYDVSDLHAKLERAGFIVREMRYVNALAAIGWYVNFKVLRKKKLPLNSIRFLDALIPIISLCEAIFPPLFGLSIFAVAEKPLPQQVVGEA